MILSQVVLLPLLLLFTWGYLVLRPESPHRTGLVIFDAVVIACAVLFCAGAYWWITGLYAAPGQSIWATVMGAVSTFHVFPAVLLVGWYLRRRVFASPSD